MAGRMVDVTLRLIDRLSSPLNNVGGRLGRCAQQTMRAGKDIEKSGKAIARVGGSLTKTLTAPIAGAGIACVKMASDFESGMSKVQSISGATQKEMGMLSEKAKEMGAKTKFSATEATEAYQYMAMAGWKAGDMMDGIEGIMYLAGATGEDLASTSDIVTDALTAFGMSAKDTNEFVDVLAQTARSANTDVSMMGESFKYVAPVAGSMGYNVQDVATALGVMANSGIKASSAGTSLRSLMSRMAAPTDQVQSAMDALGLSLQNSQGGMKSFGEVMQDLRKGFGTCRISEDELVKGLADLETQFEAGELTQGKFDKAQNKLMERAYGAEGALKAQYAAALAGKTGMSGLLAIVNASDSDFNKLTDTIYNSSGACKEMYDVANNNLQGQLTILKSTVESIAISFGERMTPYVKKLTGFLQRLADKFNSLSDSQKDTIIKTALVAASIGPAILVFGKLVTGVGRAVTTFGKIGKAFRRFQTIAGMLKAPTGIVIGIIALIAAGAFLIIKNWDKIKPWLNGVKKWFVDTFGGAGGAFAKFKEAFKTVMDTIAPIVQKVGKVLSKAIPLALEPLSKAFQKVQPVLGKIFVKVVNATADAALLLAKVFKMTTPIIIDFIKKAIIKIAPVMKQAAAWFRKAIPVVISFASGAMALIIPIVKNVALAIGKALPVIKDVLIKVFKNAGPIIGEVIKILGGIIAVIGGNLPKIFEAAKPVLIAAGEVFKAVFDAAVEKGKAFWEFIQPVVAGTIKLFLSIAEKLRPAFQAAIKVVGGIIKGFADTIGTVFSGIMGVVNGLISFITGVFTGNWSKAWEGVKTIFSSIFSTFGELAKKPINAVIGIINKAIGALNKIKIDIPDWAPVLGGKSFGINIPKIPTLGVGTDNWKGGIVQISEKGGEIVDLPSGSRVYPHDKSVSMAYHAGEKSKQGSINITIPKLADQIIVREEADIDKIVAKLADKIVKISSNMGGGELDYSY